MDCMEAMKAFPDKYFDLAIVDPEYGRGEHGGRDRTNGLVKQSNGSNLVVKGVSHKKKSWDDKPAGKEYFEELFRVSKHQIIWGCNYYYTNFGPGRIVWDKVNDGADQSQCEIAYNSLTSRVDQFRFMWRGMMQGSLADGRIQEGNKKKNEKIIHPTQKPVQLYKWQLMKYAKKGWKIIDTHLGSGSSRIAAHDLGFDFWGYELDREYFDDEEIRFIKHTSQIALSL